MLTGDCSPYWTSFKVDKRLISGSQTNFKGVFREILGGLVITLRYIMILNIFRSSRFLVYPNSTSFKNSGAEHWTGGDAVGLNTKSKHWPLVIHNKKT